MENMQVATHVMNYDPYLRYIATLALKGKEEMKKEPKKKNVLSSSKTSPSVTSPTPTP